MTIGIRYYIRRPNQHSAASVHLQDIGGELVRFINETAPGARGKAAEAAGKYLIGDGRHGLKHYPLYKYVRRRDAYGKPFFSARQRKKVMAMIRSGEIDPGVPHRTGNLQRGWQLTGEGAQRIIKNTAPHVLPVMADEVQSRHERMVGWRMISDVINTNLNGALLAAERAVIKFYREKA